MNTPSQLTDLGPWGAKVVETTVLGHPCLGFERRRHRLSDVLLDADRFPEREYLIQGDRRFTFAGHREAVATVTALLREEGVRAGDRVLLFGANSIEWVVGFWSILEVGGMVVLGNAWWSEAEIQHALSTVAPRLVLVDEARRDRLPSIQRSLDFSELRLCVERRPVTERPERPPVEEDDAAVVLFTSGTTGLPKGAVLSHRGIIATLQALLVRTRRLPTPDAPPAPTSRALLSLPLFHVGGLQQIITPLVSGGSLVFSEGRFDPVRIVQLIEDEQVKVWSAVPTMVSRVIDHLEARGRGPLGVLSTVGLGGSPVVEQLRRRVLEWFPNARRGLAVTYGLSEACGVVATGAGAEVAARPGTVGRPLAMVTIRIESPDDTGVGQVLVRSPSVMLGYSRGSADGADDATMFSIEPGPISADRWLYTGDIGRVDDDGYLYITDRSKDIVIRGGENIASPHVEDRLLQHPAVRECAVVGLPHATLGEEVGALIVLRDSASVTVEELVEFAAETLAYFEVPSRWRLRTEPLPQNITGKVLKRLAREEWLAELAKHGG